MFNSLLSKVWYRKMPYRCFVPGCNGNRSTTFKKVGIYSLPRDEILRKKWLEFIHLKESNVTKSSRICELHFKKADFETEVSAFNPQTGVILTCPLTYKRLKKGAIPSLLPCDSILFNEKSPSKHKKPLKTRLSNTVQNRLKWSPVKSSQLKDRSPSTSPATSTPKIKHKEESREMVKRKRKSTTSETLNKKTSSSSKLNGTPHTSNGVKVPEKSTDSKSKADKPVCTNPEAFAFLNIQVKQEPLSDAEMPSGPSKNNPEENISDNVQITNVRSLSSERSIEGSPSAEVNTTKKSDEGLDNDFYSKPLDMDQRDKAFGSFVACELSDLRANPALYMKTKQSILKLLTEAHFEQMSSGKKS